MAALTHRYQLVLLCALALGLVGCQEEPHVRRYQVPKVEPPKPADVAGVRLLAAILPERDGTWFIKLVGPARQIDELAEPFERFVRSIRFTEDAKKPINWTVPEGWRGLPDIGLGRYATFRIGPKERAVEVRITLLGREAGTVLANVNRWRGLDLGLGEIGAEDLGKVTRIETIGGVTATLVDMSGPGSRKTGPGR